MIRLPADEYLNVDDKFKCVERESKIAPQHKPTRHWVSSIMQLKSGRDKQGGFCSKDEAYRYIYAKYTPMFVNKGQFGREDKTVYISHHIRTVKDNEHDKELQIIRRQCSQRQLHH